MDAPGVLRVLIVDDCRDNAESLGQLVRLWGHEALVACGGQTALELASIYPPHVALLDLLMPRPDGFEVLRTLRARPELAGTVYIAVTGLADEATRRRALRTGFEHVLAKPADPRQLEALLEQVAAQVLVKTRPAGEADEEDGPAEKARAGAVTSAGTPSGGTRASREREGAVACAGATAPSRSRLVSSRRFALNLFGREESPADKRTPRPAAG